MPLSIHWIQSAAITSIVVVLFALFLRENSKFKLNEEYQVVPEGFVLPSGCEIKIDMQSGETWAKRPIKVVDGSISINNSIVPMEDTETTDPTKRAAKPSAYPEYKNITKNRIQSRLSGESATKLEDALNSLELQESWEYLEDEAPAMEFGLAIFESKSFHLLRKQMNEERALGLIAMCLQNNPLAIEKFIELKVHEEEIVEILKMDQLQEAVYKKILRILESLNTENGSLIEKEVRENIKRHSESHQLDDRYTEFLRNLLK